MASPTESPDRPAGEIASAGVSERSVAGRVASERIESPAEELARALDDAESHRLRALPFDDLRTIARL